jgi:hypothetical protein
MRQIFGIFTSLVTAVLIIFIAQMLRDGLYPFPLELNRDDQAAMVSWMSSLPNKAFVIVAISHGLAAFISGLISSLVSGQNRTATGMITISIIFIAVMIYLFTYYFPVWFVVTDTVLTAVLGFAGVMVGSARYVN